MPEDRKDRREKMAKEAKTNAMRMLDRQKVKYEAFSVLLESLCPEYSNHEEEFRYGRFGENLLVEGIDWNSIAEGNRFRCGDVLLEAVRIGAGGPASDAYKGEKVCTPMEPWFVFCQILEAGVLREGESILQQR